MHTETISGLLSVKPGNEPQQGETRTFAIEHRTSKNGKPWIKIKNAGPDYGGQPYRILQAEKTDFVDQHGNLSFNVEIEATQQASHRERSSTPQRPVNAPQAPLASSNGKSIEEYAAYATRLFGASWIEAGKWIETAFPKHDAEEMSVRDFYDFKLRVAMHNAIETGKIIRKERF